MCLHGSVMCLWGSMVGLGPGSVQERWARPPGKWAPNKLWEEPGITGQEQLPARSLQPPGCHCSKSISQTKYSMCIPSVHLTMLMRTPPDCILIPSSPLLFLPLPNRKWSCGFCPFSTHASPSWSPSQQTGMQPLSVPMGCVLRGTELWFTVSVSFQCLCSQIRSNLGSAGSRTPASVTFYLVHQHLLHWAFPCKFNPLN